MIKAQKVNWFLNRSSVLAFLKYYLSPYSDESEAFYNKIFALVLVYLMVFCKFYSKVHSNSENLKLTLLDYSYDPIQPQFKILRKVIRSGSHTYVPNYWLHCGTSTLFPVWVIVMNYSSL